MKKLTWWFRLVGGFYLLLAVSNLYVMFFTSGQAILVGTIGPHLYSDCWGPGFLYCGHRAAPASM
jgi:hypothetical protein